MIFVCAGLYAEGPSDYAFLLALLDRLVPEIGHQVLGPSCYVHDSVGIDAPGLASREERIAAAIDESWGACTLFVVHGDGAGDPESARRDRIAPGLSRAQLAHPELAAAGCVPVRETEAWMLADPEAFCRAFDVREVPEVPRDPEAVTDPKRVLNEILARLGARPGRRSGAYYGLLGREVRFDGLRRLPAFRRFEADLRAAVQALEGTPRASS